MRISQASADDVAELARLLWLNHHDEEPGLRSVGAFTHLGSLHVTVHSGDTAVPLYERLGFAGSRQLLRREPG